MNKLINLGLLVSVGLLLTLVLLPSPQRSEEKPAAVDAELERFANAVFAGGCFWCLEADFDKIGGVKATISGYAGGEVENPTYKQVTRGNTGHAEVVKVYYDPGEVSYEQLLQVFWRNVDPLVANRQFCDVGSQYRTAIYYQSEDQRRLAEASRTAVAAQFDDPVRTEIESLGAFYAAEEYHQDYYIKNPVRYRYYRTGCGRDKRLAELWGEREQVFSL